MANEFITADQVAMELLDRVLAKREELVTSGKATKEEADKAMVAAINDFGLAMQYGIGPS